MAKYCESEHNAETLSLVRQKRLFLRINLTGRSRTVMQKAETSVRLATIPTNYRNRASRQVISSPLCKSHTSLVRLGLIRPWKE